MAQIITVKLVVDCLSCDEAEDLIAKMIISSDNEAIVDWTTSSVEACEELNDSIANETMSVGDAFRPWVIFSRSESEYTDGEAGYWSNEYGWTSIDLATKFDGAEKIGMPQSRGDDATMMVYS